MSVDDEVLRAAHIALVHQLAGAKREIEQLQDALESRTVIGQAEGILMLSLGIDAAAAFDHLRRVTSHSNRKLFDVAEEIVRTRQLPRLRDGSGRATMGASQLGDVPLGS